MYAFVCSVKSFLTERRIIAHCFNFKNIEGGGGFRKKVKSEFTYFNTL